MFFGVLSHQLFEVGIVITHILHIREVELRDVNQHAPGQLRKQDSNQHCGCWQAEGAGWSARGRGVLVDLLMLSSGQPAQTCRPTVGPTVKQNTHKLPENLERPLENYRNRLHLLGTS